MLKEEISLLRQYVEMKTKDRCPSYEELQKIVSKYNSKEIVNSYYIKDTTYHVEERINRGA